MASLCNFRVDTGDMMLVTTDAGKKILIDCHIRSKADDPNQDSPDVATQLRERLPKDAQGRHYIDVMVLSHPDQDHCLGLDKHFHLGAIADYPKDSGKILIHEMWSSPIVFRRASKDHVLCADAEAWQAEAKRRVRYYRKYGVQALNERILIIGEDADGHTDDLQAILKKAGEAITSINGLAQSNFEVRVLAPMLASDDAEDEVLSKNDSSIIMRFRLGKNSDSDACRFLTGGDAGVAIWEKIWNLYKDKIDWLVYDVLLSPHHCSWRVLSWDSWSELHEKAQVSADARCALAQARRGGKVIASSKVITDEDSDPPCIRAKTEYLAILAEAGGGTEFICVADGAGDEPLELEILSGGTRRRSGAAIIAGVATTSTTGIGTAAVAHGEPRGHG